MIFFHPAILPIRAQAGRRDNPLIGELRLKRFSVGSGWVCKSRVTHGQHRFLAFIDEKNDKFEVMEVIDDFVRVTLPAMFIAFAHFVRTTGRAQTTELRARTR